VFTAVSLIKALVVKIRITFKVHKIDIVNNLQSFDNTLFIIHIFVTEVFPCFFISCKANARVYLVKTGHGPHPS
jgi:hypothetical protein